MKDQHPDMASVVCQTVSAVMSASLNATLVSGPLTKTPTSFAAFQPTGSSFRARDVKVISNPISTRSLLPTRWPRTRRWRAISSPRLDNGQLAVMPDSPWPS